MSRVTDELRTGPSIGLSEVDLETFETIERAVEIRCATGDWWTADWRGTPVAALVEEAEFPPKTTHLIFETTDGYRACLDVHTALDGLLAVSIDGKSLGASERPRLVCPGIEGIRTVKGVSEIVPATLSRGEDPEDLEVLGIGQQGDEPTTGERIAG